MPKLLERQKKQGRTSNRDKTTKGEEKDELPLPAPIVAPAPLADNRQDSTNDRGQQREHETSATVVQQSRQSTGGTVDTDFTGLTADVHAVYQEHVVQRPPGGGQVADDNFDANAAPLVRVPAAQSLLRLSPILRVDEDVSRRAAIFSGHGETRGGAAELGRSIAKMMTRSLSSSSFIVWIPVVLVCVYRPFMLEQLFNFYIG